MSEHGPLSESNSGLMARIGLIGGIGWPSTRDYYERLNRMVHKRCGGLTSADLVIRSLDFSRVIAATAGKPGSVEQMMQEAAEDLHAAGATILGVCSNTGHLFSNALRSWPKMRFVAADTSLATHLSHQNVRDVWLLGVRRTLVNPMFHEALQNVGIQTRIPTEATMRLLDEAIFGELENDVVGPLTRAAFDAVERELKLQGATNVVLACTELPLAIAERPLPFTLWDTVPIHCDALICAAASAS